jgi:invasion protein IalB
MMGTGNTNYGKYNAVFAGENVFVGQFDNVTAIHCSDFEIPQGDRVYVENYPVVGAWLGSGKVVNLTNADSPYIATYDDWLIICDTDGGKCYCYTSAHLPQANKGKMYVVKKTSASHSVTINAGDGSILIDDATSHSDNAKNGYDQVVSDGTQYWIIGH